MHGEQFGAGPKDRVHKRFLDQIATPTLDEVQAARAFVSRQPDAPYLIDVLGLDVSATWRTP